VAPTPGSSRGLVALPDLAEWQVGVSDEPSGIFPPDVLALARDLSCGRESVSPEPCYPVTNVERGAKTVEQLHRRRGWIGKCFRDRKSGMGLRERWLATVERIERLLIVMAALVMPAVVAGLR
jgi:hypothetical protein